MSREMKSEASEAFRVVAEHSYGTKVYGPYATLSAAKAAATRECWTNWRRTEAVPFTIERSKQEWIEVTE